MPTIKEPRSAALRHRAMSSFLPAPRPLAAILVAMLVLVGCGSLGPSPSSLPSPVCGGIEVAIPGALRCDQVVAIALRALAERAPDQVARGVTAIDVSLARCPVGEVPPQIDCSGEPFAQMVTVTFREAAAGGPIEPSLTVAVAPASGRVLGIANPLIR